MRKTIILLTTLQGWQEMLLLLMPRDVLKNRATPSSASASSIIDASALRLMDKGMEPD